MQLTTEQNKAVTYIVDNLDKGIVALDGPAGSGKTTILKNVYELLEEEGYDVTVAASTNKAAKVLQSKGLPKAKTVHSACLTPVFFPPLSEISNYLTGEESDELDKRYTPEQLKAAKEIYAEDGIYAAFRSLGIDDAFNYLSHWEEVGRQSDKSAIVIDEASMIGEKTMRLVSNCFDKIILCGDGNQLQPIDDLPVFWNTRNRFTLTEIHRQNSDAEPLMLAQKVLKGEKLNCMAMATKKPILPLSANGVPIICWTNKKRMSLVSKLRTFLDIHSDMPEEGEIIISRNSQDKKLAGMGLINNTYWEVHSVNTKTQKYHLIDDGGKELKNIAVYMEETKCGKGSPFRFSYAVTCHTAQGSEWDEIMIDAKEADAYQRAYPKDAAKWLYTALTRARNHVRFMNL